jgi:dTDP-4-dehydrorhamnose 3,5-epimerase
MEFTPLAVAGAYLVRLSRHADPRGFFARTFCADEFAAQGLPTAFPQQSLARSERAGTLRGMHLQLEPDAEDKYVRCVRGRIFDAFADLRPGSPTFLRYAAVELDADAGDALFVPRGVAHGYQTLTDVTDVLYAMTERYAPASARAFRFDDARFSIAWPLADPILSDTDRAAGTAEALIDEITRRSRSAAI